jgi:hypothetical protein
VLPYVALVLLHVFLARHMVQPSIFYDELGYLANARHLASGTPNPALPGEPVLYHWGYSLCLVPVFWLFPDPLAAYRAVLFLNAVLLSALYFPLSYVLHRLLGSSRKLAAAIAFGTCLYPAFVLQSSLAWSENAFIPCYALLIAAQGALLNHRSYPAAVLFGFLAGFLYAVHPRALPIIPITVLWLALLAGANRLPVSRVLASLAVMFLVLVLTRLGNRHFCAEGWAETSALGVLSRLSSPAGWKEFALEASGQLLYLAQATCGLYVLGLLVACGSVKAKAGCLARTVGDAQAGLFLYLLLTSFGVFFASCAFMLNPARADQALYGRYNEGFLALYIALALWQLHAWAAGRLREAGSPSLVTASMLVLTLVVMVGRGARMASMGVCGINIIGVWPAFRELGRPSVEVVSVLSALLFLVLRPVFLRAFWAGLLLLIGAFSAVTAYSHYHLLRNEQAVMRECTSLAPAVRSLPGVTRLSYDMSVYDVRALCGYQFLLPGIRFELFDSREGQLPGASVVISGKNWRDAGRLGARAVGAERRVDHTLWVLPGRESTDAPVGPGAAPAAAVAP